MPQVGESEQSLLPAQLEQLSLTAQDLSTNEGALSEHVTLGRKVKARNGKLATIILLIFSAFLVVVIAWNMRASQAVAELRTQYTNVRAEYLNLAEDLNSAIEEGALLLVNCSASVNDGELCVILEEALEAAENINIADPGEIDIYEASRFQLEHACNSLETINQSAHPAYDSLTAAIEPVKNSVVSKTRFDFDQALDKGSQLVTQARQLIADTDSEVNDNSQRELLATATDELEHKLSEALTADDGTLRDYTGLTIQLEQHIERVEEGIASLESAHATWQQEQRIQEAEASASAEAELRRQAEEERREAEARASAQASAAAASSVAASVPSPAVPDQ